MERKRERGGKKEIISSQMNEYIVDHVFFVGLFLFGACSLPVVVNTTNHYTLEINN